MPVGGLQALVLVLLPALVLRSVRGLTPGRQPSEDWSFYHRPSTAFGSMCDSSSRMESGFVDVDAGAELRPQGAPTGSGSPGGAGVYSASLFYLFYELG